jgi:protein tyrosine phosphatase (PTP) superfamily phosphohydrolase (DUF442 family)
MNINQAYNFKKVSEQISCSGTLKGINLNSLLDDGYEVVINLLPDDSEYAVVGEKNEFEKLGLRYEYIPIDWNEPKLSDFEQFESIMDTIKDKKVHIHCAANFRVTAFYSIYAFKNQGWTKAQISEFIGSIWQLSEYPIWSKFVSSYVDN